MKDIPAERIRRLPPYLFAEVDRKRRELEAAGADVINLGVGDPDMPTPEWILAAMRRALSRPANHRYPFGAGSAAFRETASKWFARRFGVKLDPVNEICALIGSKEGLAHAPLALLNPGEWALVPSPAYPVYKNSVTMAGGHFHEMPLLAENDFLPDFRKIPPSIARRAKIMFLNYPTNPTAAAADKTFFREAVNFCAHRGIILLHDAAYSEVYFGAPPPSVLEIPGARDIAMEFHSLSKTFNMTGWRIGWACGNEKLVGAMAKLKDNYDSGIFSAIQEAGMAALEGDETFTRDMRAMYKKRRDHFAGGLEKLGWELDIPQATFYVWCKPPQPAKYAKSGKRQKPVSSAEAVGKVLEHAQVICTPGSGLGAAGEGYVRFSLTSPDASLGRALERLERITW